MMILRMCRQTSLVLMLCAVLASPQACADTRDNSGGDTQRLHQILGKDPLDRTNADRREAIRIMSREGYASPDRADELRIKAHFQWQLKRFEAAHETAALVASYTNDPADQLLTCLLGERIGDTGRACYEALVERIEKRSQLDALDANYLVALRLAESDKLVALADELETGTQASRAGVAHLIDWLTEAKRSEIVRQFAEGNLPSSGWTP